jgi:hypothetical protein
MEFEKIAGYIVIAILFLLLIAIIVFHCVKIKNIKSTSKFDNVSNSNESNQFVVTFDTNVVDLTSNDENITQYANLDTATSNQFEDELTNPNEALKKLLSKNNVTDFSKKAFTNKMIKFRNETEKNTRNDNVKIVNDTNDLFVNEKYKNMKQTLQNVYDDIVKEKISNIEFDPLDSYQIDK